MSPEAPRDPPGDDSCALQMSKSKVLLKDWVEKASGRLSR